MHGGAQVVGVHWGSCTTHEHLILLEQELSQLQTQLGEAHNVYDVVAESALNQALGSKVRLADSSQQRVALEQT